MKLYGAVVYADIRVIELKVAELTEIGKIEIKDVEDPELDEDQILVKTKAVGICGSDLHYFRNGGLGSFKQRLPMPMGHEVVGVIEKGNNNWKKGTKVAIEPGIPCRTCDVCKRKKYNLCPNMQFLGANTNGALQEYLPVYEHQLINIDDFDFGIMLEPTSIAYQALDLVSGNVRDHLSIFIAGLGPIGLLTAMISARLYPDYLFLNDIRNYRVNFAKEIFNGSEIKIFTQTGKNFADFCFDCAGEQDSIDNCHSMAKHDGHVILIGISEVDDYMQYNPHRDRAKGLTIHNCRRSNWQLKTVVEHVIRFDKIPIKKLITHRFKFENVQKAFETASNYEDGIIKGIIEFF